MAAGLLGNHVLRERAGPRDGKVKVVHDVTEVRHEIADTDVDFVQLQAARLGKRARIAAFVVAFILGELAGEGVQRCLRLRGGERRDGT